MQPLVSIVICTYDRAEYLQKCLDSMLNQTYGNFEVIIVNGPSTDNTASILKNYPFKTVQQIKKSGLSAARNLGIKEAKGDIIAFIDDDGVADKNWIKNLVKRYKDETIGGVGGIIYKAGTNDVWEAKDNRILVIQGSSLDLTTGWQCLFCDLVRDRGGVVKRLGFSFLSFRGII